MPQIYAGGGHHPQTPTEMNMDHECAVMTLAFLDFLEGRIGLEEYHSFLETVMEGK